MRLNPHGDAVDFPKRAALPHVAGTPDGSAWFWGGSDEVSSSHKSSLLAPVVADQSFPVGQTESPHA